MIDSTARLRELGISIPPTQQDLPYSDGEPMETQRHQFQMELLIDALLPWLDERDNGYVGGNMFVYYSLEQARNQDFKGPDFFAVLGVPKGERLSWVCWEEGKTPDVVIELLSPSTASVDKGDKKDIYATRLHVPEYFWYDPMNPEDWAGFRLQGRRYEPIALEGDRLESQSLGLWLTRWEGQFKGIETTWLRWADVNGRLLPTPTEQERQRAEQERQQVEQERQRAEQERQRAEQERQRAEDGAAQVRQIVRNLLQRGMTAEEVAEVTGVSPEQIQQME